MGNDDHEDKVRKCVMETIENDPTNGTFLMNHHEDMLQAMRSALSGMNSLDNSVYEHEASEKPLHLLQEEIRVGLQRHGTDVAKNATDTMGDGDQSPIKLPEVEKQFYRELYSSGGDIKALFGTGGKPLLTTFATSSQPVLTVWNIVCHGCILCG
jgi:hypothetical protein